MAEGVGDETRQKSGGDRGDSGCPHLIHVERHFGLSRIREFFVSLRLEEQEAVTFAGLQCVRFRAFLRSGSSLWPHWLPAGADCYDMIGDSGTGALLSISAILDNVPYATDEVTRIDFQAKPDPSLFVFDAGPVDVVESPRRIEHLDSPVDAQSRVEFTIIVPKRLPDSETASVRVIVEHAARRGKPKVTLMYHWGTSDRRLWITQAREPEPGYDEMEWDEVSLLDLVVKVSDPGEDGLRILSLVKEGTHIQIVTSLDRETALDLASSFAPC